jgi:hypothetical protein
MACSNYTVMMPSLTRRYAIRAGSSSWAGSMLKTQERLTDLRFQRSVVNFEFRVHSRRYHLPLFDALPKPHTLLQQPCLTFWQKYSTWDSVIGDRCLTHSQTIKKLTGHDRNLCFWPPWRLRRSEVVKPLDWWWVLDYVDQLADWIMNHES